MRSIWPSILIVLLASGCASESGIIPRPIVLQKSQAEQPKNLGEAERPPQQFVETTPPPPAGISGTLKEAAPKPPAHEKANINLMFDQLPLPTFIQAVYGNILKKNFSVDASVAARTDLVTLRTSQPQTPSQVEETARLLLKSYGIAVTNVGGFYRIVPDNGLHGYSPQILRGRALPETPLPLRPIFQLVELNAVQMPEVSGWIKTMFGAKLQVQEDMPRNALLISGQSDDVAAAIEAIHVLDQPLMRGRHSIRINPQFWSADELAKKLDEILGAEGYSVSSNPSAPDMAVVILPVKPVNAIIAFSADKDIIEHIVDWAKQLDKPGKQGAEGASYFTYKAKYTDAQTLANTMDQLLGGVAAPAAQPKSSGANLNTTSSTTSHAATSGGGVVVDAATNTLIFNGKSENNVRILNLLQELDQPAKSALIEVTVAEVDLTDADQLGVEWAMANAKATGGILTAGTLGGLGIGTGGLTVQRLSLAGNPRLVLNALATVNHAKILATPSLLVQNGDTASIQVGQQVPVITSQQTNPTTGGLGGILQSIQYLNTGVILKVKPVIHAGDRIDIDVSQEVSNAQNTTTGVTASPTISTRKLETKLSLKDGSTVLLGGLMQTNHTINVSGVPYLMDLPGIGQLFRVNSVNDTKTELLVLITPYIISDDVDAQAITDAFRNQLGPWAQYQPVKPLKKKE